MTNQTIVFPDLDRAVEEYVNGLSSKNIEVITLKNEIEKISDDLFVKTVLLTEKTELTCFTQICLASRKHYTPLDTNRISASDIRLYMNYLDKNNSPQMAEGESGR